MTRPPSYFMVATWLFTFVLNCSNGVLSLATSASISALSCAALVSLNALRSCRFFYSCLVVLKNLIASISAWANFPLT